MEWQEARSWEICLNFYIVFMLLYTFHVFGQIRCLFFFYMKPIFEYIVHAPRNNRKTLNNAFYFNLTIARCSFHFEFRILISSRYAKYGERFFMAFTWFSLNISFFMTLYTAHWKMLYYLNSERGLIIRRRRRKRKGEKKACDKNAAEKK